MAKPDKTLDQSRWQCAESLLAPESLWPLLLELRRTRLHKLLPPQFGVGLTAAGRPKIVRFAGRAAVFNIAEGGVWSACVPVVAAAAEWLDWYLPLALACASRPFVIAHLGQSLDGRIATVHGDSRYVNGPENLAHLHRMRALADAVLVGASTVECDDPQLTTRRVSGPNPVRVIIDPRCRLSATQQVFQEAVAPTIVVCDVQCAAQPGAAHVEVLGVPYGKDGLNLGVVLEELSRRGLYSILVEGGGLTVSALLRQGMLDRLQIAVAPLILGSGRASITLPPIQHLSQGLRPTHRCYQMGQDVLFDCQLHSKQSQLR